MPKVLIVEDNEAMAVALRDGFTYEGYEVHMAEDGPKGLRLASESGADLVILDVMLPKISGLDVCRRIRRNGSKIPIIMLTARGQEIDKVLGLKAGADDYITLPRTTFSFVCMRSATGRTTRSSDCSSRCIAASPTTKIAAGGSNTRSTFTPPTSPVLPKSA